MRHPVRRKGVKLKYLNASGRFPSGNIRYYYRPKGQKGIPLPDLPQDDPKFLRAYTDAAEGRGSLPTGPAPLFKAGTIGAAVAGFLESDAYALRADSTRAVWRRMLDDIRRQYGAGVLADLEPRHIRLDLAKLDAHPANNRLKVWRALAKWSVSVGLIDTNPAASVQKREAAKSDGFTPWTQNDFQTFRARWQIGTQQRLAFELMHRTCAAIGDMVRLGPGNLSNGWHIYTRQKSGSEATCPWTAPAPEWMDVSDDLHACIPADWSQETFLITGHGRAKSQKSAAQWFSSAATEAGLRHLSAHGIRKGRSAIFRENGATPDQRMAVLGHETESEARRYSRSAELRKVVEGGKKFQLAKNVGTGGT